MKSIITLILLSFISPNISMAITCHSWKDAIRVPTSTLVKQLKCKFQESFTSTLQSNAINIEDNNLTIIVKKGEVGSVYEIIQIVNSQAGLKYGRYSKYIAGQYNCPFKNKTTLGCKARALLKSMLSEDNYNRIITANQPSGAWRVNIRVALKIYEVNIEAIAREMKHTPSDDNHNSTAIVKPGNDQNELKW